MLETKSNTTENLLRAISPSAAKVSFIDDTKLTNALLHLENKGLPTNKHEDYKYCNVDAVLKKEFKNIKQDFIQVTDINKFKLEDTITLIVLNGNYSQELSDKVILNGLHISKFSDLDDTHVVSSIADVNEDAFIALNTAFCSNGFYLNVSKGVSIPMPIHVLYISSCDTESFVNSRNLITIETGAELTLIEEHVVIGKGKMFTNFLSEKIVEANAKLSTVVFQNEGEKSFSVNTNSVNIERDANYECTTITLSGQLVRNNHNVVLNGQNSEASLNGLFSIAGTQLVDNHTLMDHQVPNCVSNELYKGVVSDKATGVFNGKIFVRKDAQKTNAYQSSKNILLSDDATINTKPQLEIYANDVKCSHGTSTGKIDENALFYLNARGIGTTSARKMLLQSFVQEIIDKVEVENLHNKITQLLENKF